MLRDSFAGCHLLEGSTHLGTGPPPLLPPGHPLHMHLMPAHIMAHPPYSGLDHAAGRVCGYTLCWQHSGNKHWVHSMCGIVCGSQSQLTLPPGTTTPIQSADYRGCTYNNTSDGYPS